MAGGKETPRQKMIGMMYLVLTALLALNVSKSILDAFVAIEENTQKANIVQVDRGNGFYMDVKSELSSTKNDAENKAKREKLSYVIKQMDKINDATGKMIDKIDQLKIKIMTESGEAVGAAKANDEASIIWSKYDAGKDKVLPGRMNLMAVQAKDQYDVPMHVIVGENIKNPTGEGKKLWEDIIQFRKEIVELTGSYKWGDKEFKVSPKAINTYKDNKDLTKQVKDMIAKSNTNHNEDDEVLAELYIGLTKMEKFEVHGVKDVHWMGATFDHSPLVAALASLSSLQQDILSARALSLAHWKGKVSTGEYSFNKVMPLAYGPAVANNGDDVELQVMMAAFDSENQPVVTVTDGATAEIEYKGDGQGRVKFKAGGTTMKVSGTVSIKKKSGATKTENWEKEIIIMKPQGSIELPELNVLYRGYPNKVDPTASGYPTTVLTGSNCSVSKSGNLYIAKPGKGRSAFLTVSGKTADGKTVQLKKVEYRVSNLPDPTLYWGNAKSGKKAAKSSRILMAKYPPEIPLKAEFKVVKWTCFAPGLKGAPPTGAGSNIGAAGALINAVKPGTGISFNATVRGPDGIGRQVGGSWSI